MFFLLALLPLVSQMEAVALFDYEGEDPATDLSFQEGDLITNIKDTQSDNWKTGSCGGRSGLFPANFVECTTGVFSLVLALWLAVTVGPMRKPWRLLFSFFRLYFLFLLLLLFFSSRYTTSS